MPGVRCRLLPEGPAGIAKNHAVLFDRYYYDLLADNKRYRHGLNPFWTKLFMRIIPKPDLIFIIDAPTQTVIRRKQEFSVDEHELLRGNYLDLENLLPNSFVIVNDGLKETAAHQIAQKILDGVKINTRQAEAVI